MNRRAERKEKVASGDGARRRVRTPGKHIVLFALAATFMLGLSTTAIRSGRVSLPPYDLTGKSGGADKTLFAPTIEILTDLAADAAGRDAFVKARLKIVARDRKALEDIAARETVVRERVGFLLRELSPEDFEGTAGMARVKAEILKRVNIAVAPDAASDVVFEDLIIQ